MKEVVLGLLGLGNIGGGVWDLVREFGGEVEKRTGVKLRIKKALVLDVKIHGGKEVPDEVLTTDKNDILEDPEIQIVCEFLGGEQPAASMMLRALENGKSVVTANKMALSLHFDELRAMAGKTGARGPVLRGERGRRDPDHQRDPEPADREPHRADDGHRERDDELHPDPDDGGRRGV